MTILSILFQVPQQDNGYDCGVYVLLFLTEFLQRKVALYKKIFIVYPQACLL